MTAVSIIHRLGVVPVEEESIVIAVSAPHRHAAWKAGEEALEMCKDKLEVWKLEEFEGEEDGVWRANRDEATGVQHTSRESTRYSLTSKAKPKHPQVNPLKGSSYQ